MRNLRSWKLLLPLAGLAAVASIWVSGAFAAPQTHTIRVAIMTDCKGAFAFGYEIDIGGAQAAFAQYAGGKVKNKNKPSAGMTGIKVRRPQRPDRRLRLRRRHGPDRGEGDAAADGAAEGGRDGRAALR